MMIKPKTKNQKLKLESRGQRYLKIFKVVLLFYILIFGFWIYSYAQEAEPPQATSTEKVEISESASGLMTLDFKDADIRNVLKIISYKSGINIVPSPEVTGLVTIHLVDVGWEKALDTILKIYGFASERKENIVIVAPLDKLTAQKRQEVALAEVQPTVTEVFELKFLDAQDARKALEPQLSPRGKVTVIEMTGQAGWEFGGAELGKRKRTGEEKMGRSKTLVISDVPPTMEKLKKVIEQIDIKPKQILIETRIMEVNRDLLRDIGFEYGTGSSGAESSTITTTNLKDKNNTTTTQQVGGHLLGPEPSVFGDKSGITSDTAGLKMLWKKLTGNQVEVIVHTLEEDVRTNTLSSPRIMTLNNQEASILVGTRYPILESSTSEYGTVTTTLGYYQDIGIQLNVVPQISGEDYINMVIHPAVTDYTQTVGTSAQNYPIITTREAETRVLIKDGETVVIGGLLKDVKSVGKIGIPFLSKIPILGLLFSRNTLDTGKIDLLIFISARIVKEGEFSAEDIQKLEQGLERPKLKKKK